MDESDALRDLNETTEKLTDLLRRNTGRSIHPMYLEEMHSSFEEFINTFSTLRRRVKEEFKPVRVSEHTTIARDHLDDKERIGYITLLAQETAILGPAEPSFIEVAIDSLEIASSVATTAGQRLQVAGTYSFVAKIARNAGYHQLTLNCYLRVLDLNIREKQWEVVADYYHHAGYCEAALGFKAGALGWFHLSADVDRAIGRAEDAAKTLAKAGEVRTNFVKYTAVGAAAARQLRTAELIVGGVLRQTAIQTGSTAEHFISLTDIPGVGSVTAEGKVVGNQSVISVRSRLDECLEEAVLQEWPVGVIAAEAVNLRIMQRLLDNPEHLDDLHPRSLEILVCKLCEGFGAEAYVTPATRDGGFDVSAVFRLGDSNYRVLIEAKKWKQERKVGLATVDRILGVRHRLNADKACIVTTSSFTNVAQRAVGRLQMEIELVDRGGLLKWVHGVLVPTGDRGLTLPSIKIRNS